MQRDSHARRLDAFEGREDRPVQTEDGECYIVKQGPEFEILAVNKLDEIFCASPAASEGKLFLRGRKHLYCIGI